LFVCCNDESTVLATGDFAGNVFVWSDMGERRLKLEPPPLESADDDADADAADAAEKKTIGSAGAPPTARAAECAAWSPTRRTENEHRGTGLPHTFLFVGHADGHVRAWDVKDGRLALDFFAGHKPGESVVSIAIDPSGERLVTGDSVGRVRLWDARSAVDEMHRASKGLRSLSTERDPTLKTRIGRADVECLGYWQAHESRTCVRALEWFTLRSEFDSCESSQPRTFFASAGEDAAAHLWSAEGQHVGRFGPDVWQLDDPRSWRSAELPVGSDRAAREAEHSVRQTRDAERAAAKAAKRAARLAREAEPPASGPAPADADGDAGDEDAKEAKDAKHAKEATNETSTSCDVEATPADDAPSDSPDGFSKRVFETPSEKNSDENASSPSASTNDASSPGSSRPSPTSTIDSSTLPDPFPSPPGYKPVRPVEDRARWTRDAGRSFESSRTYREIKALEEKKHPLRDADLPELRARSEKLSRKKPAWHTRVYIPDGDEHINEPRSRGRPYTSLHHLIHISDVAAIPRRPTTKLGRFRYGSPIKESPPAKNENESPARAPAAAEGNERRPRR
jgi:WD40 repeat protein